MLTVDAPRAKSVLRCAEALFWSVGLVLLGWCVYVVADARLYQARQERALHAVAAAAPVRPAPAGAPAAPAPASRRGLDPLLIGKIEIPRVGVSAIVREGVDDETLRRAVGHVPGTALFGGNGNVALAAHRDTFFRGLKGIAKGDLIRVATPEGTYAYHVTGTEIVRPDDTGVLASDGTDRLTLVTCWPFRYVGHAPRRFIVTARRDL